MKAFAVVLVLFLFGLIEAGAVSDVLASGGVSWTEAAPVITKSNSLSAYPYSSCSTYRQDITIVELGAPRNVCVYGDERLKIGTFTENNSDSAVVEFPYSNTMHVLEGVCTSICRYSADTDVLVTQQQVSQFGRGLVVFRHASSRIKQLIVSNSVVRYVFDTSHPDYEMKNDAGRYVWTPTFSISANGRWVVAELYDQGTVTLDLDTLTARQITTDGYLYGRGMDPTEELAVSNDGKSVAVTGQNAGLHVFDVTSECGQQLVGDLTRLSTTMNCPSTDLGVGITFPNFASAHRPRFYGDGHQLELIVKSWVAGTQRVTFVTHGTPIAHQLKILSLGDSFTSGEGETDDSYYEPGTNQGFDKCHVSTRAYPGSIARGMGVNDADAKNLACSGAKIGDIIGPGDEYEGQAGRLGAASLSLSALQILAMKEQAVDNFQPGRALQSNFIERYTPEILTIGVGGNDAGLMGKLRTCAMPDTCEWAEGAGLKETAGEIRRLYDTLGSFFSTIADQVEFSRVFIVGYPDIIEPDGRCDSATAFLMDHSERVFIQNSMHYLNQVIHSAADKAGFAYVDVEHSFDGTNLCSSTSPTSMNSVRIGDDIAVIDALPMLKIIGAETFHPTPYGHTLIANTILSEYPGMTRTPMDASTLDIEPSPYWQVDGLAAERSAFATDFAYADTGDAQHVTVQVPDGTLQPGSIATVEIHSEPMRLATFIVDEQGGLHGTVTLPASLGEGFHTLHLLAMNRGGNDIDMYQFVTTGESGDVVTMSDGDSGDGSDIGYLQHTPDIPTVVLQQGNVGDLSNLANVLGVHTTGGVGLSVQKIVSPAIAYLQESARSVGWVLFGLAVLIATGISTLCAILVSKRWAKPSS